MTLFYIFIDYYLNQIIISVKMLLQPRFFTYKRRQKQRKCLSFRSRNKLLIFGGAVLLLLSPVHLTANQLFRFKLYLKRASRKPDKTYRYV